MGERPIQTNFLIYNLQLNHINKKNIISFFPEQDDHLKENYLYIENIIIK